VRDWCDQDWERQQISVAHNVHGVALYRLCGVCAVLDKIIFINHLTATRLLACGVQFHSCLLVGAKDWSAS
jgi:hypothetical protein